MIFDEADAPQPVVVTPVEPPRQQAARAKRPAQPTKAKQPHGRLYPMEEQSPAPGRVPPHSVEAEEQLLSACLLDGLDALNKCEQAGITGTETGWCSFYVPANRVIYARLGEMKRDGKAIDLAVLAEELKTTRQLDEVGGYAYLTRISGRIPTTAGLSYFIEKVRELEILRETARVMTQGVEEIYGYSGGLQEFMQLQEARLRQVVESAQGKTRFEDWSPADLFTYPKRDVKNLLLGTEGALERGGTMEWSSPTGQGKSSSTTDACLEWCRGRPFFGLVSHEPRKVLIIEAEDNKTVMGKLIASFCARHKVSDADKALIAKNLVISQVKGVIGQEFMSVLEQKCKLHQPDILVINPVNRYIHGSMSDDKVVIEFTSWLDMVNKRLGDRMGIICVSHTGKPPKGDERKATKAHWEMSYASVGSSQWANYYRSAIHLEPRKQTGHYYLVLTKNDKSWGLRREYANLEGQKVVESVNRIPIRHCTTMMLDDEGALRPMIVWEPDDDYVEEEESSDAGSKRTGRPSPWSDEEVVSYYPSLRVNAGAKISIVARQAREGCGVAEGAFFRKREEFLKRGWIKESGGFYGRTDAGDRAAELKHKNID